MNIDASLLRQAAAHMAGSQQYPAGALYVVATPIGNLADFSLRALYVLGLVDVVACEDTRVTGGLLRHLGLDGKPLLALHHHNQQSATQTVLQHLAQGQRVAYASDAGTPAISDPGAVLVAAAAAAGHPVVPLPGASSLLAAVCVAGDAAAQGFAFVGFLPAKGQVRRDALTAVLANPKNQVLFEAPHRIAALAQALAEAAPTRRLTVARELTKQFESIHTSACADWPARLATDAHGERGEFVLVLHALAPAPAAPGAQDETLPPAAERLLGRLLQELPLKQAVAIAADLCDTPRNALYKRALALRQSRDLGDEAADDAEDPAAPDSPAAD